MKKENKERLYEMMGKLDTSFKPKLNENGINENKWYGDSTSYSEYVDELKHFVSLLDNLKFNEAKLMLKKFIEEGKIDGLKQYLTESGEFEAEVWVSDNLKDITPNNDSDEWDEKMNAFKSYFNENDLNENQTLLDMFNNVSERSDELKMVQTMFDYLNQIKKVLSERLGDDGSPTTDHYMRVDELTKDVINRIDKIMGDIGDIFAITDY